MASTVQDTVSLLLKVNGATALVGAFQRSSEAMGRFNRAVSTSTAALSQWAKAGAAILGAAALREMFKSAQESTVALAKLDRALASTGQAANASAQEFADQASELQRLTGVSDEAIMAAQRILLSFGSQADQVKELTPLIVDLASAMETDVVNAAKQVARALDGEEIKLDRINIRAKNATELIQKLRIAVGGQGAAGFEAEGGFSRMTVSLGELMETVGGFLTSGTDAFWRTLANAIDRATEAIKSFAKENAGFVRFLNDVGGELGKATIKVLGGVLKLLGEIASVVMPEEETLVDFLTKKYLQLEGILLRVQALLSAPPFGTAGNTDFARLAAQFEENQKALAAFDNEVADRKKAAAAPKTPAVATGSRGPTQDELRERLKFDMASLDLGIRAAETDRERLELMRSKWVIAKQVEDSARLEAEAVESLAATDKQRLAADKEHLEASKSRLEVEQQIQGIRQRNIESTFVGQQGREWGKFQLAGGTMGGEPIGATAIATVQQSIMQLGTVAQNVGQAISSSIGGAVNAISRGIQGLILRTLTWKEALLQVGQAILESIVGAIAEMIARLFVSFALQVLFGNLAKKQAGQVAAAWGPAGVAASIATSGTAASVGLSAYLAAVATGTAATMGGGMFASGGYTGDGPRNAPAGIVHRGEFVVPASAVSRLGVDWFEAAAAGMVPAAGAEASGGSRSLNQSLAVYLDRRAWINAVRDDMEAIAVDAISRAGWKVRV